MNSPDVRTEATELSNLAAKALYKLGCVSIYWIT